MWVWKKKNGKKFFLECLDKNIDNNNTEMV